MVHGNSSTFSLNADLYAFGIFTHLGFQIEPGGFCVVYD